MARSLNGSSQYIQVGSSSIYDATDDLTAGLFVRPGATNALDALIGRWDEGIARAWAFALSDSAGLLRFDTSSDGSFQSATTTSVTAIPDNVWSHVLCTHDSVNTRNRIYIDGALDATTTGVTAGIVDGTGLVTTVGGLAVFAGATRYFNGLIAEAAIWNSVLTDAQIAALANGLSPLYVDPNNLISYWPLFGTGSPEPDYSGQGMLGTIIGSAPAATRHAPVMPFVFPTSDFDSSPASVIVDATTVYLDLQASGTDEIVHQYTDADTVYLDLQAKTFNRFDDTFDDLNNWEIEPGNEDAVPLHYYISKLHATDGDTGLRINMAQNYAAWGNAWFLKWMDLNGGGINGTEYWLSYAFYVPSWAELFNDDRPNKGFILPSLTDHDEWSQWHIGPYLEATSITTGEILANSFYAGGTYSVALAEKTWHTVRMMFKNIDGDSRDVKLYVNNVEIENGNQSGYAGSSLPPIGIIMGHDTGNTRGQVIIDDLSWFPGTDPGEPSATETSPGTSEEQWVQLSEKLSAGGAAYVEVDIPTPLTSDGWFYWEVYIPQNLLTYGLPNNGDQADTFLITGGTNQNLILSIKKSSGTWKWFNIQGNSDVAVVTGDQWYRMEWHYVPGASTGQLRINGVQYTIACTVTPDLDYMSVSSPISRAAIGNFTGDPYIGVDNMGYSVEGWISEGSSFTDFWDFEGDDALVEAIANYPTPPWDAGFGPNGASVILLEGGIGPGPEPPDATVYLRMTPEGVEVVPVVDSATVPLKLTPAFATAFDLATVYLDLQPSSVEWQAPQVPWWDPLPEGVNKWWPQQANKWRENTPTRFTVNVRGRI